MDKKSKELKGPKGPTREVLLEEFYQSVRKNVILNKQLQQTQLRINELSNLLDVKENG